MTRYVAFLRAINITGRFVKMAELRRLFASLDVANIETYIQSGNVLFESPATEAAELERAIEARLHESLGFRVATFLRRDSELIELANYQPFADSHSEGGETLYVAFLRDVPTEAAQAHLLQLSTGIDSLHIRDRHVFWRWRRQLGESGLSYAKIEKRLGMPATVRNVSTVRKIVAKYLRDGRD